MSSSRKQSLNSVSDGASLQQPLNPLQNASPNSDNSSSNNSLGSAYIGSFVTNLTQPQSLATSYPFANTLSLNLGGAGGASPSHFQSHSHSPNTWLNPVSPASAAAASHHFNHPIHHQLSATNSLHNTKQQCSSPISVILRQMSNSPVRLVFSLRIFRQTIKCSIVFVD